MSIRKQELRSARMAEHALAEQEVELLEMVTEGLLVPEQALVRLSVCSERPLALRDAEGVLIAVLHPDDRLEPVDRPHRYDFLEHRARPEIPGPVLAFAARRPIHRAELEALTSKAAEQRATLLVIGDSAGEDHFVRTRALQAALAHAPSARLFLAPLSRAGSDPRTDEEIARRLGASFFVSEVQSALSEQELHRLLERGAPLPEGFTFPEVEAELRHAHPVRSARGFTVFFTGLSGSGKSTIGNALRAKLLEQSSARRVTFLDGDIVRTHLSKGLGFSRQDRDTNIRRIGFVASEITKHGGIAICAPIAPYDEVRKEVRRMVSGYGGFVLVHVSTPLDECERRDRKGLYAKARRGEVKGFTGIDDPYEAPEDAEMVIDTSRLSREEAVARVVEHLRTEGYL